jgi:biofilm PGA synthesis protein PgaA
VTPAEFAVPARPLPAALAFCATLALPCLAAGAPAQDYDAAIRQARAGDYQPALILLRHRLQETPADRRALGDFILISGWAGDGASVIRAYEQAGSPGDLRAQALNTVARSYRDARRWSEAIDLYGQGERRFPRQPAFAYGHIMTLADAGRTQEAIRQGRQQTSGQSGGADDHLALGYAYQRAGQAYAALEQASRAHDLAPRTPYVTRAYVQALQQAQLPQAALRVARDHPGLMEPAQERALQADTAAQLTRAASTASRGESTRFALADQALALYDRLIPAWQALGPAAKADVQRLQADSLQALHARRRMGELVARYETMRAEGAPIPAYVLGDVADAYLFLHQPDKAAPLFRRSLAASAEARDTSVGLADRTGLFYALTESGRASAANTELDPVVAQLPIWTYDKGNPERRPNPEKLDASLTRALGELYEGRTAQAQAAMDRMVDEAPGNTSLRLARAQVSRARDLPRQAERDLKVAETQAPRSIDVEVGQADTALALQEWRQAELLRDDVAARAPDDPAVRRLSRAWQVHNMAEWRVTANRGGSTGSPLVGSRDWSIDTVLYSPPIDGNWRAFAGTGVSEGAFEEGNGHYGWARAGVEWRSRDVTAQAEVSGNRFGFGTRTGAALSAAVDLDDHWQIGAGAELLSRDTPLRALNQDIVSNSVNVSVRWRGDERREWTLAVRPSFFSDGNNRLEAVLSGRQRLHATPTVQVDALLDLSASRNTADAAPYFNPKADLTVLPALRVTHALYQRYETRWEQQFLAGAGAYSQQHHGTGAIVTVGYGQRYRYNDVLDIGFMATGTSRPYDGQREREFNVMIDMTYRF